MNNEMRASLDDIDDILADIANRIADAAREADEEAGEIWAKLLPGYPDADRTHSELEKSSRALQDALRHYRRAMKCRR